MAESAPPPYPERSQGSEKEEARLARALREGFAKGDFERRQEMMRRGEGEEEKEKEHALEETEESEWVGPASSTALEQDCAATEVGELDGLHKEWGKDMLLDSDSDSDWMSESDWQDNKELWCTMCTMRNNLKPNCRNCLRKNKLLEKSRRARIEERKKDRENLKKLGKGSDYIDYDGVSLDDSEIQELSELLSAFPPAPPSKLHQAPEVVPSFAKTKRGFISKIFREQAKVRGEEPEERFGISTEPLLLPRTTDIPSPGSGVVLLTTTGVVDPGSHRVSDWNAGAVLL